MSTRNKFLYDFYCLIYSEKNEKEAFFFNTMKKSLLFIRLFSEGHGNTIQITLTILSDLTATMIK
jgi:hypothetical protein